MEPLWRVRRSLQTSPDGARRWDRAYQHLLRWAMLTEQEVTHESRDLCPGVDPTTNPSPNDRATTGAVASLHSEPGMGTDLGTHFPGRRLQRREPEPAGAGSVAGCGPGGGGGSGVDHRPRPAGAQLRPSDGVIRGARARGLPGAVSRPADEPGSPRPPAATNSRGGGGIRADADRRADASGTTDEAAGGELAAVDPAAVWLSGGSGPSPRSGGRAGGAGGSGGNPGPVCPL